MSAPAALTTVESERRRAFEALKAELSARVHRAPPVEDAVASDIPELDRLLLGGFPNGAVATLEGVAGRWSVAAGLVAAATRRSLVAVLNDGTLYPPGLADAGARLERVLIVPARATLEVARAVDLLLRSRICRLVLMPAIAVRDAVWTRLAMLAHRSGVLLVVMASRAGAALSAAAQLRLHCAPEGVAMRGTHGLWGCIGGFDLRVEVRKHRQAIAGRSADLRTGRVSASPARESVDAALR